MEIYCASDILYAEIRILRKIILVLTFAIFIFLKCNFCELNKAFTNYHRLFTRGPIKIRGITWYATHTFSKSHSSTLN